MVSSMMSTEGAANSAAAAAAFAAKNDAAAEAALGKSESEQGLMDILLDSFLGCFCEQPNYCYNMSSFVSVNDCCCVPCGDNSHCPACFPDTDFTYCQNVSDFFPSRMSEQEAKEEDEEDGILEYADADFFSMSLCHPTMGYDS
ncbi:expressed unknown protein [Seminavis robusta]|uniref:Uncharacterized protein n=1 Tax=Seminavis robusta TaxID=568900 RepID=A0A9N8DRK9_9STRA|nr:expressed unknown protein [Seminavis robusta]|eukprot:Sro302_g112110.1 n/a (144) ;mRNA; r:2516-2947